MGSKYTVISNTDEEGGLGTTSSNLIDAGINDSNTGSSSSHEFEYRPVVIAVAAHVNDNENHIHHDADVNDDHDDDDESFVTANTNNNMNMITISPTGQSNGVRFLSLSDTENSSSRLYNSVFRTTLLPDDTIKAYNIIFAENDFAIKLCKFTVFTFVSIWMMFYFVRFMGWENDGTLTLSDVWRYEGNLIVTDAMFFFVVGRLFRQRGIDHLEWIGWCFAANVYSSFITDFRMFQHSFTLYEMHCKWPWQLWVFTVLVIPLIVTIAFLHFQYAWQHKILVQKCFEMIFCNSFLLLPLVTSSYFHFHHWFAGLLIGMHLNYDVWWSRASMAWCWGCYINGIAVYGRDPVLTCAYAYFMSTTQRCPFVQCYQEALSNPSHMDQHNVTVTPMIPPDWRNCSSDAFHP